MYKEYSDLWLALNQAQLQPTQQVIPRSFQIDVSLCRSYFQNNPPRTITIADFDQSDRDYLAKQGISPDHLLRNFRKTMARGYFDPLAFQLRAIKDTAIYAVCPFTGRLIASHHSLFASINVIFYRFESIQVFYVIVAGLDGFKKNAMYFPRQEIVVKTGIPWTFEEADLIDLQTRMVRNFHACHKYLSNYNVVDKRIAVCIGFFHFAHHLWNDLPSIARLVSKGIIDSIDKFLVLREPLGDITQIFPEIPAGKVERKTTTDAIFDEIVTNNYFVVRVGNSIVTSDTVTRVYEVAKENSRPETLIKVRHARWQHSPLLWIGIRIGSRTWVNQEDGLARLIDALHAEFPGLGVVFDGFSLPADRCSESSDNREYDDILRRENRVVSDIVERLKQHHREPPRIFNIIGSSIYDANVWAHAIDFYVSPYGTIQHKVGWLAKKPGIIHTNTTALERPVTWAVIENEIKPGYVRRSAVSDVRSTKKEAVIYREVSDLKESGAGILSAVKRVQGDPDFDNYELDWQALYGDLIDLIRSPKTPYRLHWNVVLTGFKEPVKKILRTFNNTVDKT